MNNELKAWTEWMRAEGKSDNTIREYRYAVIRFLSETEVSSLEDIGDADVLVFLTASLGAKAHSRRLYIAGLRSFFSYAHDQGLIPRDPTTLLSSGVDG